MVQALLLIQEDPTDAATVRNALNTDGTAAFELQWVGTCEEGMHRLASEGALAIRSNSYVSGVLLDFSLTGANGIASLERVARAAPHTPILVLCTAETEAAARIAVQCGAQDYLLKSRVDNYVLPKAIRSMIDRTANSEALFEEKERAQVTLDSMGDAVMCVDVASAVTYLNGVAERLTGWSREEAEGHSVDEVFRVIDATTRRAISDPMAKAILENRAGALTLDSLLIRRDGAEASIEDSVTPIHDRSGKVTGAVMVFRDVSRVRAQAKEMAHLARHDSLTNLPNRVLFTDRLSQAIALACRRRKKLAVLFLDIDRFKDTNDSLGHAVGDQLLQVVAQRLVSCVRSSDTVSRQGGDEFVILLTEVMRARDASLAASNILAALREPCQIGDHEIHITASIGIVIYADDGMDADVLMKYADVAMYHAKDLGRDGYQFFTEDMNVRAVQRRAVESGLRHALERHEFALYYQPKMDLNSGKITGMEALIRWYHPERGFLTPDSFIPTAEECGSIVQIGHWVLSEACAQTCTWLRDGLLLPRIAVNISAAELRRRDFVDHVEAILNRTGLDSSLLEVELTETFLMQDSRATATVMHSLKDLGVKLALDDFGTGYSSLSYVKRFPIDTLKIDRSFVRDLGTDPDDASIVSAVIGMGKSLNMRVVAEGVETAAQLGFLRMQCCPEGQGFLLGRPMTAEESTRLLRDRVLHPLPSHDASMNRPVS
jgi:diguanylate cyclase (GGDEF)-like protein/PAS domain S-box-containing protein